MTVPALQGERGIAAFLEGYAGIRQRFETFGLKGLDYVLGFRVRGNAVHFTEPAPL